MSTRWRRAPKCLTLWRAWHRPSISFSLSFSAYPTNGGYTHGVAISRPSPTQRRSQRYIRPSRISPAGSIRSSTYFEQRKGKPTGPAALYVCGRQDDTWFPGTSKTANCTWGGRTVDMSPEPPVDCVQKWVDGVAQFIFPALMALSFMHCERHPRSRCAIGKTVPPAPQTHHGRPLVSYGELRIDPIRKVLEQQRKGVGSSLRKHFTYAGGTSKPSPRCTALGTRYRNVLVGTAGAGGSKRSLALKDYRVEAPRSAEATAMQTKPRQMQSGKHRALKTQTDAGRGLAAHSRTQNYLAGHP